MKTAYLITTILAASLLATGCNDANFGVIQNSIYLTDASGTEKSVNIAFDQTNGAKTDIPVRIAKLLDHDVEYRLEIDPEYLRQFNEKYEMRYNCVDPRYVHFDNQQAVIEAGNIGKLSSISVDVFDTEQMAYAVPIRVTVISGDIEPSVEQSTFVYVLAKRLEDIYVPRFNYKGGENSERITAKPNPADGQGWDMYLTEWTLECWCLFNQYTVNNRAIFDITGVDQGFGDYGIYVRFGDANAPYNYIQWKAWGAQLEGERDLEGNVWYHWAFQYDGSNIIVYKNGERYLSGTIATAGEPWMIDRFRIIGAHQQWGAMWCNMSQVRLWKKALTAGQIQNNMYFELDASHPDLVAFWRMEEGAADFDGVFIDATGNGHDLVDPDWLKGTSPVVQWDGPYSFGD